MKKLLLFLSFLASQLFAEQCTQQFSYFTDKQENRYINSSIQATDLSATVIDKESIIYDKKNQTIICWVIYQTISMPKVGVFKLKKEFNLNNKKIRILSRDALSCNGEAIWSSNEIKEWDDISPQSADELALKSLKKYLNIK